MKMKSLTQLAVASLVLAAACDTPPASPASFGTAAVPPAHPSPDPPPAIPPSVEPTDAGRGANGGADGASIDAGALGPDAGADGTSADGVVIETRSAARSSPIRGASAALLSIRPRMFRCFQRDRNGVSHPRGRLTLVTTVAENGSVVTASAEAADNISSRVAACIADVMKSAQFEPPGRRGAIAIKVDFGVYR